QVVYLLRDERRQLPSLVVPGQPVHLVQQPVPGTNCGVNQTGGYDLLITGHAAVTAIATSTTSSSTATAARIPTSSRPTGSTGDRSPTASSGTGRSSGKVSQHRQQYGSARPTPSG